jgi:hypothetical protein
MKNQEFEQWFAWYPVAFGPHIRWMCTVQRRWNPTEKSWYYRRDRPWPTVNVVRVQ